MKKYLFVFILISFFNPAYSQDYMKKILDNACECAGKVSDTLNINEYNIGLGICIIEASMPYQKQLKKDFGIDLNNISNEEEGEKLGNVIGIKMASFCPETLLKLTTQSSDIKSKSGEPEEGTIIGMVNKVEDNFFVVFSIKDITGKITKLNWLTFVESDLELTNDYTSLVGKQVEIVFRKEDYFDPRIEQYREFFIIKKLRIIK